MALIYYSIIYNYQPAVRKKDNVHNTSTVSGLAHINLVLFLYICKYFIPVYNILLNFLWGILAIHVAKRKLMVGRFDREGLHQLQNSFVADEGEKAGQDIYPLGETK